MRRSRQLDQVMADIKADPTGRHYGYEIHKHTGLPSGVLYPILHRLLDAGWLTAAWEAQPDGLPPRRYYELTDAGRDAA